VCHRSHDLRCRRTVASDVPAETVITWER
jgi:hypothetical protein